jgi:hypothetical protein
MCCVSRRPASGVPRWHVHRGPVAERGARPTGGMSAVASCMRRCCAPSATGSGTSASTLVFSADDAGLAVVHRRPMGVSVLRSSPASRLGMMSNFGDDTVSGSAWTVLETRDGADFVYRPCEPGVGTQAEGAIVANHRQLCSGNADVAFSAARRARKQRRWSSGNSERFVLLACEMIESETHPADLASNMKMAEMNSCRSGVAKAARLETKSHERREMAGWDVE